MRERIRNLSVRTEVLLVLLLAFGLTVPASLSALLSPDSLARRVTPPITNDALHRMVLYEICIMAVLIPFLRVRGWTRERLGIRPNVQDCVWGVGILLTCYGAYSSRPELQLPYSAPLWDLLRVDRVAACYVHAATTRTIGSTTAGERAAMVGGSRSIQSRDRVEVTASERRPARSNPNGARSPT